MREQMRATPINDFMTMCSATFVGGWTRKSYLVQVKSPRRLRGPPTITLGCLEVIPTHKGVLSVGSGRLRIGE